MFILPLTLVGCLIAGCYGMLHNQLSYTVSPDYFHEFKYIQFRMAADLPGRVGAAIIGWRASWWMGVIIAVFIVPVSLFAKSPRETAIICLKGYAIVACTALILGLCALLYAVCMLTAEAVGTVTRYDHEISNPLAFMHAGFMHNFSYLGALIGIIFAVIWQICHLIPSRRRTFLPEESE